MAHRIAGQQEQMFYKNLRDLHEYLDRLLNDEIGILNEDERVTLTNDIDKIEHAMDVGRERHEARLNLEQKERAFDEMYGDINPELGLIKMRSFEIGKAAGKRKQKGGRTRRNKKSKKSKKTMRRCK